MGFHFESGRASGSEAPAKSRVPRERLLHKLLQNLTVSAPDALALIQRCRVTVNGHLQRMDRWLHPDDEVAVNGHPLEELANLTILVHKPAGTTLTEEDPIKRPSYMGLLPDKTVTVRPAGRIDIGSSGLMLLTNRKDLSWAVSPGSNLEAAFVVVLHEELERRQLRTLMSPHLYGKMGPPTELEEGEDIDTGFPALRIVLPGGRTSDLRRAIVEVGGAPVRGGVSCSELGPLTTEGLEELGMWRYVSDDEVNAVLLAASGGPTTPAPMNLIGATSKEDGASELMSPARAESITSDALRTSV